MSNGEQVESKPQDPGAAPPDGGQAGQAGGDSPEARLQAEVERLKGELEAKGKRLDEVTRAYSGLVNDQQDFRGRLNREKDRVLETERGNVAVALLETVDEMDRALSAATGQEGPLAQGVKFIRDGLLKRLNGMGIERISLVGRAFDPSQAEAVDLVPVSDPEKADTVVEEAVAGYKLGNRVLRPARVRVAKYVPQANGPGSPGA